MKDNRLRPPKARIDRCHWCATMDCGFQGIHRTVEGGCGSYTFLDPALRRGRWEGKNLASKRRIRIRTTVYLLSANVDFLNDVVLPSNPKMFIGRLTRGIHACVDAWLGELDGAIPEVPVREPDKYVFTPIGVTLLPASMEGLNRIVAYWRESNRRVSRSDVVDYFLTLSRMRYEKGRKRS